MERNRAMNKLELKTGMMVETRNGVKYLVMLDCASKYHKEGVLSCIESESYTGLRDYNDDLTNKFNWGKDIVVVRAPTCERYFLTYDNDRGRKVIWERPDPYKLTAKEEAIIQSFPSELKENGYIFRESSENYCLMASIKAPRHTEKRNCLEAKGYDLRIFEHLFKFVTFENPLKISEILRNHEVVENE